MPNTRPWTKFFVVLLLAVGWGLLLSFGVSLGKTKTPPLGTFLNPYEGFYRSVDTDYWEDVDGMSSGLRAAVDIVYDERLVPHIYAATESDLYFAQGYVQAQHRLFQLDLTARSAAGTLSEVLGTRALALDRFRRRVGGIQLAKRIDSLWRNNSRAYEAVQRYADGVNAFIAQLEPHEYPIEYKLLDFEPQAWSPQHTALVALNMAYTLNFGNSDIAATNTRNLLGAQSYDFLFPGANPKAPPIIPPGTGYKASDTSLIQASERFRLGGTPAGNADQIDRLGIVQPEEGLGSNNWVLSGSKTASGFPLLANDPHLGLTLPSIWFECELHAGTLDVHGVSLPGVPGITIGFNENAAWGVTNVGHDVLDWHRIKYTDESHSAYVDQDGQTRAINFRTEEIIVRDGGTVQEIIAETRYGPIVVDADANPDDSRAGLAMEWLTLQRPSAETINAFLSLNRAASLQDFRSASELYEWPAQNMVFANATGDIALRISGTLPRRYPGEGRFLLEHDAPNASGYISPGDNPMAINPEQGYLTSTNQRSTDESYPYYYLGRFDDYRSRRANQLLAGLDQATMDDMKSIQSDSYSVLAAEAVPILMRLVKRPGLQLETRGLLEVLEDWDYVYDVDALGAVVFDRWINSVASSTWDELAQTTEDGPSINFPETWRLVELLDTDPLSPWFDIVATDGRESASDIVTAALVAVGPDIANAYDGDSLAWAHENKPGIAHLARIPAFSKNDLEIGGTSGTLNAQTGSTGPSWRMIVSLEQPVRAEVVYPGGQSGRPGHPHYADMIDDWAAGRYYAVSLSGSPAAFAKTKHTHLKAAP